MSSSMDISDLRKAFTRKVAEDIAGQFDQELMEDLLGKRAKTKDERDKHVEEAIKRMAINYRDKQKYIHVKDIEIVI